MDSFIKNLFKGNGKAAHSQFMRFGKGRFENRAALNLQKTNKIKLRGGFEWANDFINLTSDLIDTKFSGLIFSKEKLNLENEKEKPAVYQYEVQGISSEKIKEIKDKVYSMLLDCESGSIKLKIKKRLPKPGKSSKKKVDDKFCQLEADLKYWPQIKEAFMLPECKKAKISHVFEINQIIMPEGEKGDDFAKIRELSKRAGKIIRKLEVDKQESEEEVEFEA